MKTTAKPKKKVAKKVVTITTDHRPERDARGCACPCGGYADAWDTLFSKAEIASDMNCGRPEACCICSFKCRLCKKRVLAKQAAPEFC